MKKMLMLVIAAILIFILLRLMNWIPAHFIVGLNPLFGPILLVILTIIIIPLLIIFIRTIVNKKNPASRLSPGLLFLSAGLGWLFEGIFSATWLGDTTLFIHLHDTYFVLGHTNTELLEAIFMFICATIYYCMNRLFNRPLNTTAGLVHLALTIIPFYLVLHSSEYLESPVGLPRRYIDYSYSFRQAIFDQQLTNFRLILFISGQLVFLINIIYSLRRKTTTHPFNS